MVNGTEREDRKGLLIVFTGNGKGKTTASLGIALRASGYGWRTLFVQFIKGTWHYGELDAVAKLRPVVDIRPMGVGFVHIMGDTLPLEEHREAARKALHAVRDEMESGEWDVLVLDEINVAVKEKLLTVEEVLEVVSQRPDWMTLIMTGRYAPPEFVDVADLVTEMREIKHPFQQGIEAQKGIDF
jgi:cob(I)alamin adenosyltransferase